MSDILILPQPHIESLPNTSGIYAIICTQSDSAKIYVGQSKNLRKRQANHFSILRKQIHSCKHLQNAYSKYGEDAFYFTVLEEVVLDKELLTQREQYWMDYYRPLGLFNTVPSAGSMLGWKHSEESKMKISQTHLGRKTSEETKRKLSIANIGHKISDETKIKLSAVHKNRSDQSKPVAQLDFTHKVIAIYPSIQEASRQQSCGHVGILNCCRGTYSIRQDASYLNVYKGFYWCFLKEDGTPDMTHIPNECQSRLFN